MNSVDILSDDQQKELKTLIEQLKMAVNGSDKSAIEMRQSALQEAYSKTMQTEQAQSQQADQHQGNAANDGAKNEDVIDADFEEVSNG